MRHIRRHPGPWQDTAAVLRIILSHPLTPREPNLCQTSWMTTWVSWFFFLRSFFLGFKKVGSNRYRAKAKDQSNQKFCLVIYQAKTESRSIC